MKYRVFVLMGCMISMVCMGFAETGTLPEPVQQKIEKFFEQLKKAEIQPAFETIVQGSLIATKIQQVQNLINQTNNGISLYGPILSYAFFSSSNVEDVAVRAVYVSKNASYPMRWIFVFYKASDAWVLISIEFDDNIEALFD
ncbi:MAG: hypothetical protein Q8Q33_08915 [Chlamydiota bacterium]|nr:hypothetical protein [Chlamydiota bacterium]